MVPARHLSQPSVPAVVQRAYDTTELPTRAGEGLEVIAEDSMSGWLWCRSSNDQQAAYGVGRSRSASSRAWSLPAAAASSATRWTSSTVKSGVAHRWSSSALSTWFRW